MARNIPTVTANSELGVLAFQLATVKVESDALGAFKTRLSAQVLEKLEGSVRTPYGVLSRRSGRRTVKVTDPQILARIAELEAKVDKLKENALKAGQAVESVGADSIVLTGAHLPD